MKLLLFSDLHCDTSAATNLVQLATQVDVAVGAGDFGNGRRHVNLCIDILRSLPCPTVLVPGNNESFEQLQAACAGWENGHVLHGTGVTLHGVPFFGLGGGVPVTPFGSWSYDFTEDEAAALLQDFPQGGVLVSHSPPLGILDRSSSGTHLGSTTVRHCITTHQPALVVCGHIHASAGRHVTVDQTLVVNAGPAGMLLDLPHTAAFCSIH